LNIINFINENKLNKYAPCIFDKYSL